MEMILAETRSKVDRLTSLPDHLIHHILSFLDIKHVVLTAILSRKWRALSASVSNLHFHGPANSDLEDCDFDFIRLVDRALLFNSAPKINKFQLSFNYHKNYVSHVDAWIRFLISKGIQELDLDFTTAYGKIGYKLRSWVLNCETLTRLKLRGCGFGVYNIENYVNFTRLTSLSISHDYDDVYIDVLQDLLKGCPLLEDLVLVAIRFCRGFVLYNRPCLSSLQLKRLTIKAAIYSRIDIVAPNLQMLKVSARFVDKCSFEDMPFLEEANLDISRFSIPTTSDPCEDLSFQNLGNAGVLSLSSTCIQVMPIPTFKDLQFYFKTKVLTLRTGVKKYEMPGIANLLWSSPHLENLIIDLVPSKCIYEDENCLLKDDFDEREYWESLTAIFPCLVHHLKTIKIIGFMGRGSLDSSIKVTSFHEKDEQIKLVRFLLKNAMVLEKMVIHVSDRPEFVKVEEWPKILLGVAQKLVAFPRASADAEVMPIPTFKDLHFNFKTKLLILRTGVQKYEMPGIANLLWSSPYLENLVIDLVPSNCIYVDKDCELKYDFDEREYWESLTATFPCLLHHLKTIKITGFMGGGSLDSSMEVTSFQEKDERIKLVKFFLKNATVLEKMIIHVSNRPEFVDGGQWPEILLGVTQKLIAFPRASSRAEVIFSYK